MPNVNYAAEYSQALAQAYPYLSYFPEIWAANNSNLYKPGIGKTMYIPTLTTTGAHAVNRDQITGTFNRNWDNALQAVTLEMDREWDTLVDPMDVEETNQVASIANITRAFNEQQKVPEMDAYMAAKLYSMATPITTAPTVSNIIGCWDLYLSTLAEDRCNMNRVVCYMNSEVYYTMLKYGSGITRYMDVDKGAHNVDRSILTMDGIPIHPVPSSIMKSSFNFTTGWSANSGAKKIYALVVCLDSIAAPVKYETAMISAPNAQRKGKYLYYERYYYGAFKLSARGGVVVHAEA